MTRQSRSSILELLERHGLEPRRAYGQHFLADPNLIEKVVALAGVEQGDRVLEVGAGTGALTVALAEAGAEVVAYEVDERFRPVLEEILAGTDAEVRFADAMDVDFEGNLSPGEWKLVANLPYNVGTPLLLRLLLEVERIATFTVMVQREVADRLAATPGTEPYGLPSVVVALTARVVERFSVPPQVFVPPPAVSSAVLRLDRVPAPERLDETVRLARSAFGQRRKMLRRSLRGIVSEDQYRKSGLDDTARPEDLTPEQFVALAEAVHRG